jgi:hypothetical protein
MHSINQKENRTERSLNNNDNNNKIVGEQVQNKK